MKMKIVGKSLNKKTSQKRMDQINGATIPVLAIPFPDVKIRPSWIKSFKGCEERYRLEQIEKVPFTPKKGIFEGNILDAATGKIMSLAMTEPSFMKSASFEEIAEIGKMAGIEKYDEQVASFYENNTIPKFLRKFNDHIPEHFWKTVFSLWAEKRLDNSSNLIGVQKPVSFEYKHKSGIQITVQGTADYVYTDLVCDAKKTKQTPWQRRKDEDGEYLTDGFGDEKYFAKTSPEYQIQQACYMRGFNIDNAELDYFVLTKEPKYEIVPIPNTSGLQIILNKYIDNFIEAHIYGVFDPNIYYEYCHSCEYKGKQCLYTKFVER